MKNKKMFTVYAIIVIVFGVVVSLTNILFVGSKDENVEKYKQAMSESIQGNSYHYSMVDSVTTIDEEFGDEYYIEMYKLGAEKLRIDKASSSTGEFHWFCYNEYTYDLTLDDNRVDVYKHEGITPTTATPNEVDSSYYSITDKNVSYEETKTQIVVTYDNQYLIGKRINGAYKEADKDGYTSAVSVAYFDKEWNLEKLEVTEKWISITDDGQEYERIKKINIQYHDTSEDEIKKIFEDEYRMLENLLKD